MENNTMNLNNIAGGTSYIPQQPAPQVNFGVVNTNPVQAQPIQPTPQPIPNNVQPTPQPQTVAQVAQQQANDFAAAQAVYTTTTAGNPIQQVNTIPQPVQEVAQAPVFGNAQPQPQVNTVPQPVVTETQPVTEEPVKRQEPQQAVEEVKPKEPIVTKDFIMRREDLVKLINNASKVAICSPGVHITSIVQLMFTPDGLIVKTTDNQNTLTQIDRSIKYENEISLGINITLFKEVITKLDTEFIELRPNLENRTIMICADGDEFRIPEQYDSASGEVITVEDQYNTNGEFNAVVDYDIFKTKVDSATTFMGSNNVQATMCGVYCSDRIIATDGFCAYSTPNVPALTNEKFYLTEKYLKAMSSLSFDGEVTVSLIKNEAGDVIALNIHDDKMALAGPSNPDISAFPLEDIMGVINRNLNNKCSIDANKFTKSVQLVKLFQSQSADHGLDRYLVSNTEKKFTIRDRGGATVQNVPITPLNNNDLPDLDVKFANTEIQRALSNVNAENLTVSFDEAFIKLEYDDVVEFVTTKEDD